MRITANQLTILRIVTLPVPCILLYGGLHANLIALALFGILGFTDYLDGLLARRHGTTPFGTLFDPIADKIFITVIYIPFVQLGYIPVWTAFLLFLREFLITEVRRLLSQRKLELRVTELAKSKTTIQMAGAGFILLVYLIPTKTLLITLFALPLAFSAGIAIWALFRTGRIPHRILLALCCFSYILLIGTFFAPHQSAFLYVIVIVGVTYISGFQYIMTLHPVWKEMEGDRFSLFFRLTRAFLIPMLAVAVLHAVPESAWMAIAILSLDFASQGLDTWISALGLEERLKDRLKSIVMIPVPLVVGTAFLIAADFRTAATAFLWVSLCLSALYTAADFYGHRRLLITGSVSS